jgi:hypothetical protein
MIIFLLIATNTHANEACSRVAIINQEEVLVDPSSSRKGEGLRFHLEKDAKAKYYLERYQEQGDSYLRPAILGSIGTGLLLSAFIVNTDSDSRKALLVSGASTLLINFLVTKTIDTTNEQYFQKSIEEYNKRHQPKIYMKDEQSSISPGIFLKKDWEF